jgi:hypothetical protein
MHKSRPSLPINDKSDSPEKWKSKKKKKHVELPHLDSQINSRAAKSIYDLSFNNNNNNNNNKIKNINNNGKKRLKCTGWGVCFVVFFALSVCVVVMTSVKQSRGWNT